MPKSIRRDDTPLEKIEHYLILYRSGEYTIEQTAKLILKELKEERNGFEREDS